MARRFGQCALSGFMRLRTDGVHCSGRRVVPRFFSGPRMLEWEIGPWCGYNRFAHIVLSFTMKSSSSICVESTDTSLTHFGYGG